MGSRRTFVCAGFIIMLTGVMGKLGAVLSCIPAPVIGGVNIAGFGMITSLGISYLEFVDLRSSRNLLVLAVSLSASIALPVWVNNNPGAIDTGHSLYSTACIPANALLYNYATGLQFDRKLNALYDQWATVVGLSVRAATLRPI